MTNFSKDEIVEELKPHFKTAGFKKLRANWYKEEKNTILVFNVQGSQWGPEYYINLGIYIRALGAEVKPPSYRCHIQRRIEHEKYIDVKKIVDDSVEWYDKHNSIQKLKKLYDSNQLPFTTFLEAAKFLKTVNITE
jgi:hypothetical protein